MSKKNEKTLSKTFLDLTPSLIGISRDAIEVIIQKYSKGYRVTINTANLTYYLIDYDVLADEKPHTIRRVVEIHTAHDDVIRAIAVRTNDADDFMELIQDSIKKMKNRVNVHNENGFIKLLPKPTWKTLYDTADGTIQIANGKRDDETIQSIVMLYSSELRMDINYNGGNNYHWYRHQTELIHISPDAIELTHELFQFINDIGGKYCEEICTLICNYISRMLLKIDHGNGQRKQNIFEHEIRQLIQNAKYTDPRIDADDDSFRSPYASEMDEYF